MSYSDVKTGRIVGAKKGTLSYLHEEGHIIFNDSDKGVKVGYKQQFYFYASVTSFIIGYFFNDVLKISSLAFLTLFWYYFIYEEVWCWNYAFKNLKGGYLWPGQKRKTFLQ